MNARTEDSLLVEPKKKPKWREDELVILQKHYETIGPSGVMTMLPGRTRAAIKLRADRLKLKTPTRYSTLYTPAFDDAVRALYQKPPRSGAVVEMEKAWKVSREVIYKRAEWMGLVVPRYKAPEWTEAEDEILRENIAFGVITQRKKLAKAGFKRTFYAIYARVTFLKGEHEDLDSWTSGALAKMLGVNPNTVCKWVKAEGLPATRRGTRRTEAQGGDEFIIKRRALRMWIRDHAQQVDLRKVDRFWFIDLAFGG